MSTYFHYFGHIGKLTKASSYHAMFALSFVNVFMPHAIFGKYNNIFIKNKYFFKFSNRFILLYCHIFGSIIMLYKCKWFSMMTFVRTLSHCCQLNMVNIFFEILICTIISHFEIRNSHIFFHISSNLINTLNKTTNVRSVLTAGCSKFWDGPRTSSSRQNLPHLGLSATTTTNVGYLKKELKQN